MIQVAVDRLCASSQILCAVACFCASSPGSALSQARSNAKYESEQMKNFWASVKVPSSEVQLFVLWRDTSLSSLEQSSYCKPGFVLLSDSTKLASHLKFFNFEYHCFLNSVPFYTQKCRIE